VAFLHFVENKMAATGVKLYSFPMKDFLPVQSPQPGLFLACVDPLNCVDTQYVEGKQAVRPVIYGSPTLPPNFQFHDTQSCPTPRVSTFQTLEEFYNQNFLQTFTDCLNQSDFHLTAPGLMGFSGLNYFSGTEYSLSGVDPVRLLSTPLLQGENGEPLYSHSCCLLPSFYIANVRGKHQNTAYYNPLFTSVHDFNCFLKDGCVAGGSIRNVEGEEVFDFPKASPRSVLWYLQNSIAKVRTNVSGNQQFWLDGEVGVPGPLGTNNSTLYQIIRSANGVSDTPAQSAIVGYGQFACPSTDGTPGGYQNLTQLYPTSTLFDNLTNSNFLDGFDADCCTRGFDPVSQQEGGALGESGYTGLLSFLNDTQASNEEIPQTPPVPPTTYQCGNFHCFESPYCQNLLNAVCSEFHPYDSFSLYAGPCMKWRNWATTQYSPLQSGVRKNINLSYPKDSSNLQNKNLFPTHPGTNFPAGSYNSGVDLSVHTLVQACQSVSQHPELTWPAEVSDQCEGILNSGVGGHTNFPRVLGLTNTKNLVYTPRQVTPYIVNSANNQIQISLTYTKYVYYGNDGTVNKFVGRDSALGQNAGTRYDTGVLDPSGGGVYGIVPKIENVVELITLYLDNIAAETPESFYAQVSANFNLKLAELKNNGNSKIFNGSWGLADDTIQFLHPQPNNGNGGFNNASDNNGNRWPVPIVSVIPAAIDHSSNLITWTTGVGGNPGQLQVIQVLSNVTDALPSPVLSDDDVQGFSSGSSPDNWVAWVKRTENLTYLFNAGTTDITWNSILDYTPVYGHDDFGAWCCYNCGG
jgi:hypothetical protein